MATSTIDLHAPYKERVKLALQNLHLKTALSRSTVRLSSARVAAMTAVDGQRLRDQTRQMKEYVLRNLPDLLEELERNITANGGHVHWARDASEAQAIVLEIARQANVQKVVKSKSMVTEEIHLNQALEEAGLKVVETDLGEYIIQLAGEPPSHIVAPVVHKRLEDISAVFQEKLDMPPTLDPEQMCAIARARLRQEFLTAEMGISGVNFAIAETGTVCIVTNEGNGRMVTSMPRVYVAVMGIEKLVPTVEDAFLQYQALCRSSTGQQCSVYLSLTSGPRREGDVDGPEEFHVVLLDNGRSDMLARGYGEALLCVRCGACLNVCPVYREIGGHAYGSTYSGPIGAVISPLLPAQVTNAEKLPHASSLCGACRDACPVKIDLPRLLLDLRSDQVEANQAPWLERQAMEIFVRTMSSRRSYENAGKLASLASNTMAALSGGNLKFMPPPLSAWTQSRDFPPFAKKSFRELWAERMARRRTIQRGG
ncbi:LutB/LldF family L-lactate oxidation iron-sulfur protein [Litorilinea aerophila]|uniref:Iron-sulfur cluster-binding protein n=1 Tax=Litorilinea aerophila TaxID=1204385 RepID=A0A540VEJ9_9CHLR|nr:LutB/LldF family L-lactate oxidation iron-sulfur protein [Litorilinea aerophila]MCC9077146.1 LutB/LldF family L-lactate oxidation iron-sulfur protein [Litorilinea aerophila]